jgi:arylsulfatase A-like enzyme
LGWTWFITGRRLEFGGGIEYTEEVKERSYSMDSQTHRQASRRLRRLLVAGVSLLPALALLAGGLALADESSRPNIILIVVDALKPDHLGCYGYERPTSPYIDSLASGGVVFETAITHAPWTKVSFPSFLTSMYPFQHGISNWESVLPESLLTLAEFLKEEGYSTAAVVQYAVLAPKFNILQGFDIVEPLILWREGASKVSKAATKSLEAMPEPFFLMTHFFDAHKPYNMPEEYIEMVRVGADVEPYHWNKDDVLGVYDEPSEAEIAGNLLLYDAGIRYADEGIGEILQYLDDRGISGNTMIMITADHGEAFWEHGLPLHSTNVYDEALKVPLVFHYPRQWTDRKWVEGQVRLIDLFPTVAELVGGSIPTQCEGSSLLGFIEGDERVRRPGSFLPVDVALTECTTNPAPATRSLRTDEWKLICESLTYTFELYRLNTDPGETDNVFGRGHAMEDSLLGLIGRVPALRFRGWRLAFTGKDTRSVYRAELTLPDEGRFGTVRAMTRPAGITIEIDDQRTTCTVTTEEPGTHVVLVDTEPQNVPVRFAAENPGKADSPVVYVGQSGEHPIGERISAQVLDGLGPPSSFEHSRRRGIPAVHLWWLPGTRLTESGEKAALTDEERERLKALGYIQ